LIAVAALCVATGWFLLWPLVMSACALCYLALQKRLQKRRDARLRGARGKVAQTDG
jgi:amino acid efflux transporter